VITLFGDVQTCAGDGPVLDAEHLNGVGTLDDRLLIPRET